MSAMQDVARGVHRLANLVARDRAERAQEAREAESRLHVGNRTDPVPVGSTALSVSLAHVFRRHLLRHPEEKWRRLEDGKVRATCSCGAALELAVGAHLCPTEECDRVWFWTGKALSHAHPDQLAHPSLG